MLGRRVLLVSAALVLLLAGCVGLSWRTGLDPVAPAPTSAFPAVLIATGAQLAAAGNCIGCHTAPGGPALAGGLGLETGFGTVYSSNLSPDPATGIGQWSLAAFTRALREGISRDGSHLFPAFPYTHFTRLRDEDVQALYAYFMTRAPVQAVAPGNTLRFPFNVRALQAGWKLLYFEPGVYRDDDLRSVAWNRGAYLADGLTHCAACHTPRNRAGAELRDAAYAGSKVDGWEAPALNAANPAPLAWTQQDLLDYLRHGESERHGVAAGVMADVVHRGLAVLPEADIQALAMY
ncbi:aldehyde dehydrogenase, partial [Pelomonas sp. HMWF004]